MRPFHGSVVSGMTLRLFLVNRLFALPTYLRMRRYIKRLKPDIVHLNSTCLFVCAVAVKHENTNIPVVCHVREPLLENFHGRILKRFCQRYVDRFIAIDRLDALSADPALKKTSVIYNFVNLGEYRPAVETCALREELSLPDGSVVFLYLARFSPGNGALELVRECANIREESIQFVFAGMHENRLDRYEQRIVKAARGLPNVHLLPFRSDVKEMLAAADAVICPFTKPHFSRAVIEAAAMGKPCVASRLGPLTEVVLPEETGLFFDSARFETIREPIRRLAGDPVLRQRMGQRAATLAHERFGAERNALETFEVYREVLNDKIN